MARGMRGLTLVFLLAGAWGFVLGVFRGWLSHGEVDANPHLCADVVALVPLMIGLGLDAWVPAG